MNIFKPHFWYQKNQRNGAFILGILIIVLQVTIVFVDFSSEDKVDLNTLELLAFQRQLDSLKTIAAEDSKPKIYPFNPNYITDFKGVQLGMSITEIDKLLAFRETGKFVNSKKEFQKVTSISDSLLNNISSHFKFPDWVLNRNKKKELTFQETKQSLYRKVERNISTKDINKATVEDLKTIYGIGEKLSERIIKYRSKLQGFSMSNQLYEVWGLEQETANKVLVTFKVIEVPNIKKSNINTLNFKELLKNPYIDYELCKKIFNYRDEVAELQNISELKNIIGFPLDLYDRIVLYLVAE